ncbi:MAG TPA: PadR family transcriptional regulator [Gaiellaceae bacterium]|nr:PadR family transcriptional regulator [Gaiellaceae bacterium]
MRHHRHPRARSRRLVGPGHWHVHARVERFVEPSLLLLLRERPLHGYELLERLPELGVEGRIDIGNLYRLLRGLEDEGLVRSEWSADLPGPAKRTYELTAEGRRVLDSWVEGLRRAQGTISSFLDRYEASLATPTSGRAGSARASVGTDRSTRRDDKKGQNERR